ncbi:unnamed protein product [Parnassius apollo]|uniref:(apollo) hypothetical protein n=1 Tax=Parnassius apollo TaxID=110799 RepID=A0A8S3XV33_PARAO|nr:unnamed protein product [Parnassius apollo]
MIRSVSKTVAIDVGRFNFIINCEISCRPARQLAVAAPIKNAPSVLLQMFLLCLIRLKLLNSRRHSI